MSYLLLSRTLLALSLCVSASTVFAAPNLSGIVRDVNSFQNCRTIDVEVKPIFPREIFPEVIYKTPGRDKGAVQMYFPIRNIAKPLAEIGGNCLAGRSQSCKQFQNWVDQLALNDSLYFDRKKHIASPPSLVTGTLAGNLTLRPIAFYTALLREQGLIEVQNSAVDEWMLKRAKEYEHLPKRLNSQAAQNIVLTSAVTKMVVAITTGKLEPFQSEARQIYNLYFETMRKDGSFPEETKRGVSALKYSNTAVANLVLLAELLALTEGEVGIYIENNKGIEKAIEYLLTSIEDESLISQYAESNVAPTDLPQRDGKQAKNFLKNSFSWIDIYRTRHPHSDNAKRIDQILEEKKIKPSHSFDETLGLVQGCFWNAAEVN